MWAPAWWDYSGVRLGCCCAKRRQEPTPPATNGLDLNDLEVIYGNHGLCRRTNETFSGVSCGWFPDCNPGFGTRSRRRSTGKEQNKRHKFQILDAPRLLCSLCACRFSATSRSPRVAKSRKAGALNEESGLRGAGSTHFPCSQRRPTAACLPARLLPPSRLR